MNQFELHAVHATDAAPEAQASPLMATRRFLARCSQELTWRGAGMVTLLCALYGALLSLNPKTGGAPESMVAYLHGFAAALELFLPVYLVVTVTASFAPKGLVPRAVVLGLAVVIGIAIGYGAMAGSHELMVIWQLDPRPHSTRPLNLIAVGWLGLAIYLLRERDRTAEQSLHDEAERAIDLDRQVSEAQLQVLQSQIEPHFLFNSLAHVRRLYQTDPHAGRAMMTHLSRYLSATQSAMRENSIALGHELALAEAYLSIQQTRMNPRLAFEINVPAELRDARVPPMMVTTLVENAVKHGLSALPEGGAIDIGARLDGHKLHIWVSDTGQGFQATMGAGVGLSNIRARLAILYGVAAQLSLTENTPHGVRATIAMPMRREHRLPE